MKKTMIITSVRPSLMGRFIDSFNEREMSKKGWGIALMTQEYTPEELQTTLQKDVTNSINVISSDHRIPPYIAKATLIENNPSDIYCCLDDDCVLLETVDYETPIQFVQQDYVGIVSCNWVRFNTPKMMAKKNIVNEYKKQKIVFTGGGMLFSEKVGNIISMKPRVNWLFDDVQFSIDSYTSGFVNYRYLGSVIEHNIVTKGGIKTLYNETQMTVNDPKYITLIKSKDQYQFKNSYYMPRDSALTQYSNNLHKDINENIQK
tara:strand:+ start:8303 stop:9085 length:783 start_codon:yes stop_codon:yes gene_type:complete